MGGSLVSSHNFFFPHSGRRPAHLDGNIDSEDFSEYPLQAPAEILFGRDVFGLIDTEDVLVDRFRGWIGLELAVIGQVSEHWYLKCLRTDREREREKKTKSEISYNRSDTQISPYY